MSLLAWLSPMVVPVLAAPVALRSASARRWLLPLAPLPALLLALLGPPGPSPELAWVLLDTSLDLDVVSRPLLVMTAVVWAAAGASARRAALREPVFAALFLLTMAGNLGLLLAADVVTFYVLFAWMTFAAYGLVVHERTAFARRAGRIYVVLAVLGEVSLLAGLVLAVSEAGSTGMVEVAAALGDAPRRDLIITLLLVGFGVKVGLVPLHVWLPLAHPAAPVPASAVLSGTMLKAGLVGWLRVLPLDGPGSPGWGATLIGLGLAGALLGVVLGTVQTDPKVLLAYSSVSQMGFITTAVGVGMAVPGAATLASLAAVTYAVHHGFAKAALFLGIGLRISGSGSRHHLVLAGMGLAALALAGAPLTSGWIAKQELKDAVATLPGGQAGALTLALSFASAGTTVLMTRLLWLIRRPGASHVDDPSLLTPWSIVVGTVALGTWALRPLLGPVAATAQVTPATLWDGLWPVLVGVLVVAVVGRRGRRRPFRLPALPAGDVLVLVERGGPPLRRATHRIMARFQAAERWLRTRQDIGRRWVRPGRRVDVAEAVLLRWRTAGTLFVLVGVALSLALGLGAR